MIEKGPYCNSLYNYSRLNTRVVQVGDVAIGGDNPIRVQSMTTTNTKDTKSTVQQSIRMIEAGCELVRITAPSIAEAENLNQIKKELRKKGYKTPIIADIHYTPNAAELAARIVEKVRVNPGNYADKKKFEIIEYTDSSYEAEIERIRHRFTPLVKICKEYGTAMRIGTNHGSLSDRILSRYGDTPLGMVESAMEFLRICEDENYYNIVLSMKASNTQVMVQAYRLLVKRMLEQRMNYPLHLGVTEAGEGEDGRIKSAVGIGALLEDGLGDTIRVSLTEEPELEIPVARTLVDRYANRSSIQSPGMEKSSELTLGYSPFEYKRRRSENVLNIGGENVPRVISDFSLKQNIKPASLFAVGYNYNVTADKWNITDQACDYLFVNDPLEFEIPGTLGIILSYNSWMNVKERSRYYPLIEASAYLNISDVHPELNFIKASLGELNEQFISKIKQDKTAVLFFVPSIGDGVLETRKAFFELFEQDCPTPVIMNRTYQGLTIEDLQLYSSTDMGALLIDGLGEGICVTAGGCGSDQQINQTGFGILQATRARISKTEYISCPSCGRTLFDLQETTAKIRNRTNHLKGVKIGIMGCIVNGPGEMADADYGYVGVGKGKISLYKGQEVVKKNIQSEDAVDELITLIKENGDWVEA